jgi:hypothetical protein
MRLTPLLAAAIAVPLMVSAARADAGLFGIYGMQSNDTGGIIPWSPAIAYTYREIAADACARWHKVARVTSVHRRYGDYVGFRCDFPRGYDPVKGLYAPPVLVVKARY